MPWIARDKTGTNPYRLFGVKPDRLFMVSYEGERLPDEWTWSIQEDRKRHGDGYNPLSNTEPTLISKADCPMYLEPGEGPVEVVVSLKTAPAPRRFEGEGI